MSPSFGAWLQEQLDDAMAILRRRDEALCEAWGIIANAGGGHWTKESAEWQRAAHEWAVKNGYRLEAPKP